MRFETFDTVAAISEETIAAWAPKAPAGAAEFWREHGAGIADDGFVRVVDPEHAWQRLSGLGMLPDDSVVMFVTALGDVILWRDEVFSVACFRWGIVNSSASDTTLAQFVADLRDPAFRNRALRARPYLPAAERLGVPGLDECFGYVPLLVLGGSDASESLQRMGVYEHIAIIGQFGGTLRGGAPLDELIDVGGDATDVPSSWADVRAVADAAGVPRDGLTLPGDEASIVEGALRVVRSDAGWVLESVDYGLARVLVRRDDEAGIMAATAAYVSRALPDPVAADPESRERILAAAAPQWMELAGRLAAGELLIDLPAGLLVSRIGALDGFLLYPAETSVEARSLPPTVLTQDVHEFVVRQPLRVRVALTPPWFGFVGGGVRITIDDPSAGIRDLVVADLLRRVDRAG